MPDLFPWQNLGYKGIYQVETNIKNWIFSRNQLKHMRPPSHYLCVWYWHCTIPGRQPPLYTHICELRNFARLKISTFHHMSSSQAGQVSQSLLWVSCKLTPSDLSRVYHVSHSGMIYPNWHCVYFWTNLIKEIQSLLWSWIAPSAGTRRPCPACAREQDIFSSLIVT